MELDNDVINDQSHYGFGVIAGHDIKNDSIFGDSIHLRRPNRYSLYTRTYSTKEIFHRLLSEKATIIN